MRGLFIVLPVVGRSFLDNLCKDELQVITSNDSICVLREHLLFHIPSDRLGDLSKALNTGEKVQIFDCKIFATTASPELPVLLCLINMTYYARLRMVMVYSAAMNDR
jgi:hypothetical protein